MAIAAEVNAFFDLILKATNFAVQLRNGWYKSSAEVDTFLDQVPMLCEKHDQWSAQLRRHGLSEDKYMLRAVEAAIQVLDEQQKYVERLQKHPLLRLRKKAFPAQLLDCLNRVRAIVDAGPKLLEERVVAHDLLERNGAQTPARLPFVPDPNYVPIADSILKIQKALEREEGPRVVTLYGGPGLGKSSAVKYIALQYAEEKNNSSSSTFPDGVFYLLCGRGAQDRVKDLHLELFKSLGFGAPPNDSTAAGVQEGEYFHLPSHQMNLRSRLLEQRLLIILDDLWEGEVLQQLLVPTKGVKYLITSQNREIWRAAEKVQMENPTILEARHIMANFTDGLPTKGKFPDSIQMVTDNVIRRLNYHPLSLADVGTSVHRKRATDERQWKVILDNIHVLLDENDFQGSPVMFDRPYNLTVGAAMMLMVDSLRPEIQRFLFLIALLGGEKSLPEPLVRFFHKLLQSVPSNAFLWKYYREEKYLEDRSLIELHSPGDQPQLAAHSLRMHFIREQKPLELRSIASQILASSDQGVELTQSGDGDGTLVTILSAVYFQKPFKDVVANVVEKHLRIINDGVIDRNIISDTDILHLKSEDDRICSLVWLLNVDDGEPVWKRQAHGYAKKIIIKLARQGILDDDSMACLLKLPQTTSAACKVLSSFAHSFPPWKKFSSTNGETMRTLLTLLDDNSALTTRRAAVCLPLLQILDFESKDTILNVAATWMEILAMDSNLSLQIRIMHAFTYQFMDFVARGVFVMGNSTGILEVLMRLFFASKDYGVQNSAGQTIMWFCRWKCPALKIAAIPGALAKLVNIFISKKTPRERFSIAGALLGLLSCVPQNRVRLRLIDGCLEGLEDVLANMEVHWRATCEKNHRDKLEKRATIAAGILAQLAVENELRGTIGSLPGVQDGLLFLQRIQMARLLTRQYYFYECYNLINSTRALTILYPDQADLPSLECVQEVSSSDGGPKSGTSSATNMYVHIYWTRVAAHLEVGAYKAALESLNLAHSYLEQIPSGRDNAVLESNPWYERSGGGYIATLAFRFLLVMLEDHAGALLAANTAIGDNLTTPKIWHFEALAERGIIKRLSGDLQGALDDLNLAYNIGVADRCYAVYYVLKHRSYIKHLMKDDEGAREDTKAAQKRERVRFDEETFNRTYKIIERPVNYFGSWELKAPWTGAILPAEVPVMSIIGRQDIAAMMNNIHNASDEHVFVARCQETTPGLNAHHFIDAMHFLHQEKYEEVNKVLLQFLQDYKD